MSSTGGFTAAGILVLALAAGGVGGAMVSGGSGAPVSPPAVSVDQVAEESADAGVTAAPTPTMEPTAAPVQEQAAAEGSAPVAQTGTTPTEIATAAADRAAAAAKRSEAAAGKSEQAAERAEEAAPDPVVSSAPAVAPEPAAAEPAPAAPAPECTPGATKANPLDEVKGGTVREYKCQDGKWVLDSETYYPPKPTGPVSTGGGGGE